MIIQLHLYQSLTGVQLIRPEFQEFHDNEQSTLQMVRDVVDTLEGSAVNQLHTHALYSIFLRALISARVEQNNVGDTLKDEGDVNQNQLPLQDMQQQTGGIQPAYQSEPSYLMDFNFNSEMGPVADISTFPPTMAPIPAEDTATGMTMDNILSSGFWDSMLVPGK